MDMDAIAAPVVMSFSHQDPSGSTGVQADIETLSSLGCHCSSVITGLCAQDSRNIKDFRASDPVFVVEQSRAVLDDMGVAAFKVGMLASIGVMESIHTLIRDHPQIPVVLDPVLSSSDGSLQATEEMIDAFRTLLLPLASVATVNSDELRLSAPEGDSADACAHELLADGCAHLLVTGGHDATPELRNRLWRASTVVADYEWERLPGAYAGAGCTLAAAMAGYLAHGAEMTTAVRDAQAFTWHSLKHARRNGRGRLTPNRLFWSTERDPNQWHRTN